ncbi:MAG: DUF5050 domain-containing protein [Clostridia bacterium]|nr:DUF5050 domain-containing protein [Clostridia bacterium]
MKKFYKILVFCLVICMAVGVFAACDSSKYGPIGTTEYKDSEVVNNGGLVIQQGGYLYYVNGMDATANITKPQDNYFGKASVKGSIMKSEINEDGSLGKTDVVVPKMFYTSASNGGFYIYGEWIYYLSPSTKTDNQSNVLTSQLVAFRTKIDGTKTQEIATLSTNSVQYVFTEKEFIYYSDNTLNKVGYDNSKVDKKPTAISEEISSVLFTSKSTTVFFVKSSENNARRNNNVFVYVDGEVKEVTTDSTYPDSGNNLKEQFTYSLVSYDVKENVLFYTKAMLANDASKTTSTYGYKFGDDFTLDPSKEKKFAVSALSNIVNLGFDKGVLDMSAATLTMYKPLAKDANVNDTQTLATLSSTGAKIVKIDENEMYFVLSNALYKVDYNDKNAIVDKLSEEAINSSWLTISVIGDYMYYIENTYSYMYRLNLNDFVKEPNNLQYAEGSVVSGTRKATLSKNDEDKVVIKYVDDDANEEDVEYFQIPKFMTETDAQTYAEALYAEWEAENKKK